jgi:hypothetical protein
MQIIQQPDQVIDIAKWQRDEEFAEYPEGARDKTLIYCPKPVPFSFLTAGHRYLFKLSNRRYVEQFWVEIFTYHLGLKMKIPVPPAFVAYDSRQKQAGALIEWFLNKSSHETFIPGGDYCQQYLPDFNRKKGTQHNFKTVSQIFEDINNKYSHSKVNWKNFWAKTFLLDALIGNTDRHQDNWGILESVVYEHEQSSEQIRIAPVFDNGTSMAHEIFAEKFHLFNDDKYLERYALKGAHHIRWTLSDIPCGHVELLNKIIDKYPETRCLMISCLKKVDAKFFENILDSLTKFHVPVMLSKNRAIFMLKLLEFRHQNLLNALEK